ncbi:MAG: DUF3501 family protein [Gemmataceae bacterium]
MTPLTPDDLIPLDEYVVRRADFFAAHVRYCDRYRRVRVGPSLTLLFENRQTLWFRAQEIIRVARLSEPELVQLELDWYNQLLPLPGHLQAILILEDGLAVTDDFEIELELESTVVAAKCMTARPADRATGGSQWLEFALFPAERKLLADHRWPVRFIAGYGGEQHVSAYLSDDVRQSLLDDLRISKRDAA